jgi:flagellar basal body-associated protein FliL
MKKSRLGLFKSTSMLISVLGVIMIIATVAAVAYVGFSVVSSSLTGGISSGTQYDQLAELKSNYTALEVQFNDTGNKIYAMDNITLEREYVNAQVELVRAQNDLSDVESALSMGKPAPEVDKRLQQTRDDLKIAHEAYNSLSVK